MPSLYTSSSRPLRISLRHHYAPTILTSVDFHDRKGSRGDAFHTYCCPDPYFTRDSRADASLNTLTRHSGPHVPSDCAGIAQDTVDGVLTSVNFEPAQNASRQTQQLNDAICAAVRASVESHHWPEGVDNHIAVDWQTMQMVCSKLRVYDGGNASTSSDPLIIINEAEDLDRALCSVLGQGNGLPKALPDD